MLVRSATRLLTSRTGGMFFNASPLLTRNIKKEYFDHEDLEWLEASKKMSQEEFYARKKQRELLGKMAKSYKAHMEVMKERHEEEQTPDHEEAEDVHLVVQLQLDQLEAMSKLELPAKDKEEIAKKLDEVKAKLFDGK
eukprot:NODE_588_length_723_cov_385.276846_g579_i0.p1 GENE.NODE_588_length_723_cov_385.276846_g579_i0~~NODE_588_length_723_cov_385.276846_g579_i0.p1  ORF type:complete len:138 (+),score=35.07 NODE_588_length_723_cov_385.276846_g579_i0:92-505(+)